MKKTLIFLLLLFLPLSVLADEAGEENNDISGEDFFRFSADIQLDEPVERDFVGAGGTVNIKESVSKDVFVAGGSIFIHGDVGGDVRAAGNVVEISSRVGGNIAVFGQVVEISEGAVIEGSARIRANKVILRGTIEKNADIDAVEFEQYGFVKGDLNYKKIDQKGSKGAFGWFFSLVGLFGMLIAGLVFVSVFPKTSRDIILSTTKNPLKDLAWGVAFIFLIPIACVVLMLTIIGFPVGLILIASYAIGLYFGQVVVGIILGTYIFGVFKGKAGANKFPLAWTMTFGIVVLWFIIGIPVFGWLIKLIALALGLGVLVRIKINLIKKIEF